MSITVTVIRAGIRRSCSEQRELALALGVPCDNAHGFTGPAASVEDLDMDEVAEAAGFRVSEGEPYGDTYTMRQRITPTVRQVA